MTRHSLVAACLLCACAGGPDYNQRQAAVAEPPATNVPASAVSKVSPQDKPRAVNLAQKPEGTPTIQARAPSYDLAADLALREKELKDELGARTAAAVAGDVFLLVSPAGAGALSGPLDITRRSLEAWFNGRFGRKPARAISVLLFPEARSYSTHCRKRYGRECTSPYGFYVHSERRIVMNVGLGVGTLTHELVHPLVEADFPRAPTWLNEGIASLFEQFSLPKKGEIHGWKNWRHPRLLQGMRSKSENAVARPAALFKMSDDTFRGDLEDLNYATARYFCQWMDQKDLLWAFYQRYRDSYDSDPTGRAAFVQVSGKTPEEAHAEWARWVRAL